MRASFVLALGLVTGCASKVGTPDRELGGLVIAKDDAKPKPIDVARAAREPAELGRALAQSHAAAQAALGGHKVTIHSHTVVTEGTATVDDLTVDTTLELRSDGQFHVLSNNSADYGDEITFADGALYLRPRYARWHKRAPNDAAETVALRDRFWSELAADWDLLAPGAELSDQGAVQAAGRAGRKVAVKLAPNPGKPAAEPLTQRKWREGRVVEAVTGELVLDAASGVALSGHLTGKIGFSRDGRRFEMAIDVTHAVDGVGADVAIAAPPAEQVVATPGRPGEVDERDTLLQGIAPPAHMQNRSAAVPAASDDAAADDKGAKPEKDGGKAVP